MDWKEVKQLSEEASDPSTLPERLHQLAQMEDFKVDVADNPSTSVETLQMLSETYDSRVFEALIENPSLPLQLLVKLAQHPNDWIRTDIAGKCTCPPDEVLNILVHDPDSDVRGVLAERSDLPNKFKEILLHDSNPMVRSRLAYHANSLLLQKLATDKDQEVRLSTAPYIDDEILLRQFAEEGDEYTRSYVAGNKHAPLDLIEQLAKDTAWQVRSSVVMHSSTPKALFEKLAFDPHQRVRREVASSPRATSELLCHLARDPIPEVSRCVVRNKNSDEEVWLVALNSRDIQTRLALLQNRELPASVLKILATDNNEFVRESFIKKTLYMKHISRDILALMINDESPKIRAGLVVNLPQHAMTFVHDGNADVRLEVAQWTKDATVHQILINDTAFEVRAMLARNPHVNVDVLEALSIDEHEDVRYGVSYHLRTREPLLSKFVHDSSERVRRALTFNLCLSDNIHEILAQDRSHLVRQNLAMRSDFKVLTEIEETLLAYQNIVATLSGEEMQLPETNTADPCWKKLVNILFIINSARLDIISYLDMHMSEES